MRTGKNSLSRKLSFAFLLFSALLGVSVSVMYSSLREQAREVCSYRVKQAVAEIVSSESSACLARTNTCFFSPSCRSDGSACMLTADSAQITALENDLRSGINRRLSQMGNTEIAVPLGTLTGLAVLNEKGPELNMTLQREGNAETHITGTLTEAGINQTRYALRLTVTVTVLAQLPGYSEVVKTQTEQTLCETVIIGNVPQRYNDSDS